MPKKLLIFRDSAETSGINTQKINSPIRQQQTARSKRNFQRPLQLKYAMLQQRKSRSYEVGTKRTHTLNNPTLSHQHMHKKSRMHNWYLCLSANAFVYNHGRLIKYCTSMWWKAGGTNAIIKLEVAVYASEISGGAWRVKPHAVTSERLGEIDTMEKIFVGSSFYVFFSYFLWHENFN